MTATFEHWTQRATDGTGDLFQVGDLLIGKNRQLSGFTLSIWNEKTDDFALFQQFKNREEWKRLFRLARVVSKTLKGGKR